MMKVWAIVLTEPQDPTGHYTVVTAKELKQLRRDALMLRALTAAGVDNWEFHGDALDDFATRAKAAGMGDEE